MNKLLLIFIFLSLSINAQDNNLQLKSLQNKFETINDLTVDVVQRSGGQEVLSGKLSYKRESSGSGKINLDMKNNLIVSDGSTIWNFNKSKNKVIINSVDESDPSYFSFSSIIYEYPSQCYLTTDGDVLILTPKEDSFLNFDKAKLFIGKENLVNKLVVESAGAGSFEIIFSNYILNQNLPGSKFEFTPPEGSTVIDLR